MCVCSCAFTNCVLSFQLAYCVVQFMEKDATVTEYVRLLQCLINASLCCQPLAPVKSYFANAEITVLIMQPQKIIPRMRDFQVTIAPPIVQFSVLSSQRQVQSYIVCIRCRGLAEYCCSTTSKST